MDAFVYGEDSVSVALEEVLSSEWADKVYQPDILEKPNQLYKKPG
jgi:4-oxalocrotonate tautomerase